MQDYMNSRKGDRRERPVEGEKELFDGDIFYISCIDEPERLAPFYEKYKDATHAIYQKDIYSGAQWLEIMPRKATKAHAARQLASLLGCKRIVAFGDSTNDIPLFEAADERYAVANAADVLKERATAIIASNDEDGVAHWLDAHWDKQ
jgi:hydroxymethylpyrimidine pyrophosphatase-like HAD family hydrolase